jgi:large subunit ribosomal protein L25
MKVAKLSGSPRTNVGKKDAKAIRDAELVPCVLYGQGTQTHFSVKKIDIERLVITPEVFQIELDIDGKKSKSIIQDLQQHPVKGTIQHVDFYELNENKPVKVALPVRLTGASVGVLAGGKLLQVFRRLRIMGLPSKLPEAITIDISKLKIGQSIRVGQIPNDGLTFLDPANAVVVSVKMSRGAIKGADDVLADDDSSESETANAEVTETAEA